MYKVVVNEWQLGRVGSGFSEKMKGEQLSFDKVLDSDYVEEQMEATLTKGRLFEINEEKTKDINELSKEDYFDKWHGKKEPTKRKGRPKKEVIEETTE